MILSLEDIEKILGLATKASELILEFHESSQITSRTLKSDHSPVTEADMQSHYLLMEGLPKILDVPVISEENASLITPPIDEDLYWLIDPLDGTKGFLKKNGEFAVNIALIRDAVPVFGVISLPVAKIHYFAAQGLGAFKVHFGQKDSQERLKVNPNEIPKVPTLIVNRDFSSEDRKRLEKKLGGISTIVMGSSIKFCLLAEGKAHLYLRLSPCSEWDIAPGVILIKESGCGITDLEGNELQFNKPSFLNSPFVVYSHRKLAENTSIL